MTAAARLIESAEILMTERGVDAVSSRDIAMRAGHKNVSAVQYHFGDKDGLMRAIAEPHLTANNARRVEMLDEIDPTLEGTSRLRKVVEAAILPLVEELGDSSGRRYLQLSQIMLEHPVHRSWAQSVVLQPGNARCRLEMINAMAGVPPRFHDARLEQFRMLVTGTLSAEARRVDGGGPVALSTDELTANLIEVCSATISAPDPLTRRRG